MYQAGGVLLTRGGAPLETGFQEGTLSSNRKLAEALREVMGS